MQPSDQDVLHADRHLSLDGIGDFGPNLRAARDDRLAEPSITVHEIEHGGRLAAVIRNQVAGRRLGRAARPRGLDEHLELGGFPTGQRLPVRGDARRERTTVQLVQARGDAIHHVPRHHPIRRQLAAGDRDETMRAFEHAMLARHLRRIGVILAQQGTQPHPRRHNVIRAEVRIGKRRVG